MSSSDDNKVEVYHRVNKLKLKVGADSLHSGPGFIDPKAIQRAETVIMTKQSVYPKEIEQVLTRLQKAWDKMVKSEGGSEESKEAISEMYHAANHVKDLASTFSFVLMQHFGQSLREFTEKIDASNKAHHIITKAHIDVMFVVYNEGIRDDGDDKAKELKLVVAKAIEKYS